MGKALTYIGGILLAVLSALLLVPRFVDWNDFRGAFEEEASRMLGREVRVGGGVNLWLLPTPYVRFEKLRISDTAGTLGEPFFRAESFTMGLAVAPLLRGALEATHIELSQPVLTLEVDAEGRGNWREVALAPAAAALLPAEIRLNSVDIVDGVLAIKGGSEGELVRLTQINGELSADNLDGPYKFRGVASWHDAVREVRLATARPDPDGTLRFKALVKALHASTSYTLDAKVNDLAGRPRIEGDLVARVQLPASAATAASGASRKAEADREFLDLRSKIQGDAFGLTLPEITISFDQSGQPQLMTGTADVAWRNGMTMKLGFGSRWLDLDKVAGQEPGTGPMEAVRALLPSLVELLPEVGQVDARLTIDQVNLGGEVASNLLVHLVRTRGPMQVRELHVGLPGGSRLEMSGSLTASATAEASFLGDIALRGTSYARFLGWAAKGQTLVDTRNDGPFAVQGRLGMSNKAVEVSGLTAELLGAPPLTGAISYVWEGRRRFDIRLEGQQVNLSAILPGSLAPANIKALLWPGLPGDGVAPAKRSSILSEFDARTADARVWIKAAELSDGERALRDVDAVFAIEKGRLQVTSLRLSTLEGLRFDVEGEIADIAGEPRGVLRGDLSATTAAGLEGLLAAFDPTSSADAEKGRLARLERLAPARLAGALRYGARGGASVDLSLDGTLRGSRVVAQLNFDNGLARWREGLVDTSVTIDGLGTAQAITDVLLGEANSALKLEETLTGGQLAFKAAGRPTAGMLAAAALKGDGLSLEFDGRVRLPGGGAGQDIEGTARIEAHRAQPVLTLIGLGSVGSHLDVGVSGLVDVASKAGVVRITPRGLAVGGSEIAGTMTVTRQAGALPAVEASIRTARANVGGLLVAVLDRQRVGARDSSNAVAASDQIWPEAPFNLAVLDGVRGRLKFSVGALALADGLSVHDAAFDLELAPGQVTLTDLSGRVLGGRLNGRLALEKAQGAGVALAGALRMDDVQLEAIAGKAAASGTAGLSLQFSGRGLSPQALVAALQGKGEIALGAAQLHRFSPSALPLTIDGLLDGTIEVAGEALKKRLREGLANGTLTLPPNKLAIQIGDGALKLQRLGFETQDARGSIETVIELTSLRLDSEWRVEPKAAANQSAGASAASKAPLPGISLVYVGPLRQLESLEPRLSTDTLERELTVRRMERDVERLERLRREDEERYRREVEPKRSLDEERRRTNEAARVPAATAPAPDPRLQAQPSGSTANPLVVAPLPSAGPAKDGQAVGEGPPAGDNGAPPTDFQKRPGRAGPPRTEVQPRQPAFNPFGERYLGAN